MAADLITPSRDLSGPSESVNNVKEYSCLCTNPVFT